MKEINGISVEFGQSIPPHIIQEFKALIGSIGFKKLADEHKIKRVVVNRREWFSYNRMTKGRFLEIGNNSDFIGRTLRR